jgi:hypothetical protein
MGQPKRAGIADLSGVEKAGRTPGWRMGIGFPADCAQKP